MEVKQGFSRDLVPIELTQTNSLVLANSEVWPSIDVGGANVKDEAWKTHSTWVLKEHDATNWSGYNLMQASNGSVILTVNRTPL